MAPIFLPSAFGVVAAVLKITILQKFGSIVQKSARLDMFCCKNQDFPREFPQKFKKNPLQMCSCVDGGFAVFRAIKIISFF